MLKNKFLTILLMFLLISPVVATVETTEEFDMPELPAIEQKAPPVEQAQTIDYKQPVSKKKIAKKFLLAMGGVAASSMILFVGLSIYNKIREGLIQTTETAQNEASLETPNNLVSATKTFLEKTHWDS